MLKRWKKTPERGLRRKNGLDFPIAQSVEMLETRLMLSAATVDPSETNSDEHSVARQWNELLLDAIRRDTPRPTVHARNLFHVSAAMYDAWAAYDNAALPYFSDQRETIGSVPDVEAARAEAISHAAYGVLVRRFAISPGADDSLATFKSLMFSLDYDPNNTSTEGDSPAAVGNRIAQDILLFGWGDGANEAENYADTTDYQLSNPPLVVAQTGTVMEDPNRWQPLTINGQTQQFLTPHWGDVETFALTDRDATYLDPGEPPQLGGAADEEFKRAIAQVIEFSSWLDPNQNVLIDISPGTIGNNALGYDNGTGYAVNPVTGQPYDSNVVNRADYGRVLAEFWADGPQSETPPGHWNTIANAVSDQLPEKWIHGTDWVDNLEWDVKLYVTLNAAVHDAAIAAWDVKEAYDYVRPISMIRHMGGLGQSSDPNLPSYHPEGLPLIEGLIEVITPESIAAGYHAHLAGNVGQIAIFAWTGHPEDPEENFGGIDWILAENWLPYQAENFVTPPFAGYVSGHSTFSRASAEVLASFTGSPYFPGGLGTFTAIAGGSLGFEFGPSEDITLQWATYFDAADEAGLSRIYGGIHVDVDDYPGREMGSQAGLGAYRLASRLFAGDLDTDVLVVTHAGVTIISLNGTQIEVTDQQGKLLDSAEAIRVRSIEVVGGSGQDELRVDFQSGGRFWLEGGILFDGQGGQDTLLVLGNASANSIKIEGGTVRIDALRIETQSTEIIVAQGFAGNNSFSITGQAVANSYILEGGPGDDLYRFAVQNANLTVRDAGGIDTLDFSRAESAVRIALHLDQNQPQRIGAGDNWLRLNGTIENVIGTPFDDWIMGNDADNHLIGGAGDDMLFGRGGNNRLEGGHGNDRLFGGPGDDILLGGHGNDLLVAVLGQNQLHGGPGDNTVIGRPPQAGPNRPAAPGNSAEARGNAARPQNEERPESNPRREGVPVGLGLEFDGEESLRDLAFAGLGRVWSLDDGPQHRRR